MCNFELLWWDNLVVVVTAVVSNVSVDDGPGVCLHPEDDMSSARLSG